MENIKDIIQERINIEVCPICDKDMTDITIINDVKYGKIKICKKHYVANATLNKEEKNV